MKHAAKKKTNPRVFAIAGLAVAAALVAVGALVFFLQPSEKGVEKGSSGSAMELALTPDDFGGEQVLSISTKYCDLFYPVDFEEVLKVESSSTGDNESIAFYGMLSEDESVLLFEISFGDADGVKIGEFVDSENIVPVYLIVEDIVPDESWGSERIDMLFGMQEGLNVVVGSLEANDSFRPVSS